jgi:hypothetical protein
VIGGRETIVDVPERRSQREEAMDWAFLLPLFLAIMVLGFLIYPLVRDSL